jgi:hypothetical protein
MILKIHICSLNSLIIYGILHQLLCIVLERPFNVPHVILVVRQPITKLQHKEYKYKIISHRIKILRSKIKTIENSCTKSHVAPVPVCQCGPVPFLTYSCPSYWWAPPPCYLRLTPSLNQGSEGSKVKGKCALGPFLSVLVIKCPTQHFDLACLL